MRNTINFDTSNRLFGEIIGNSKHYRVPKYQRDYSWGEEQWDELWQDILAIYEQEPQAREQHYMGYLVLQKQEINAFTIIDGQQRLTTLSLLVLAALQILQASTDENDAQRIEIIKGNYISTKSSSSLTESYKLELNRNNDEYYRNDLASLSLQPRKRSIKTTEHQMRKAKEFYERELDRLSLSSSEISQFIESIIANYLLFTVIEVSDDVNAYKVFETLNARGVQLSTPDLLKNYLFSIIDPRYENSQDIERQEEQWSITLNNLGTQDFSKFLRCFWNSRKPLVSTTDLFKKIKSAYTSQEDAVCLLKSLREASSIYAALRKSKDESWNNVASIKNKINIQNCLLALDTFSMMQPYPVLLSAYFVYGEDPDNFAKICKWLHAFCIRYQAICNWPSNDAERHYNRFANAIHERQPLAEVKKHLISKMPSDDEFRQNFANKTLSMSQSPKKAHYLLASIENYLNPSNPIALAGSYTIEHILPKSNYLKDDTYWRDQFGDLLEQDVSRLGNLALLSAKANRDADTSSFAAKKTIYRSSNLKLLHKLCQYDDWNPDNLRDYQAYMARQAVKIWAID